ncbi:MAG: hypothetical protein Phyf2KO_24360 [Phycisphaerales bacterium]
MAKSKNHFESYSKYSCAVARLAVMVGHAMTVHQNADNGWSLFFKIDQNQRDDLMIHLAKFISLTREAEAEIRQIEALKQHLYMRPINHTKEAIHHGTTALNWNAFRGRLEGSIETFEFVVDAVTQHLPGKKADEQKIDDLIEKVRVARDEIEKSDLATGFKLLLTETLSDMIGALYYYKDISENDIDKAVAQAYGEIVAQHQHFTDNKDNNAVDTYLRTVHAVRETIGVCREAMPLLSNSVSVVKGLIGSG